MHLLCAEQGTPGSKQRKLVLAVWWGCQVPCVVQHSSCSLLAYAPVLCVTCCAALLLACVHQPMPSLPALQRLGPEHDDASSLECMRSLINIGDRNWQAYVSPDIQVRTGGQGGGPGWCS